jgi:ankyrin repeat protein
MEIRAKEISDLLEQERRAGEQEQRRQDELLQASTMQQQVNAQKFLFESGLPCNLPMLVNGLIILELPLDLRDHVRGDTLLHAAVREGDSDLVRQLLEHGASSSATNWAGLTARASTQEPALQALLDASAAPAK